MNKQRTFKFIWNLSLSAIMMTLSVILARFASFYIPLGGMPSLRFGMGNLPVLISSLVSGPIWGMIVGGGADLIGALAFPVGAYFFGYTIDSALLGLFPWVVHTLLHGKKKTEFVYCLTVSAIGLSLALGYLYSHTVYSNGRDNFSYELVLDNGMRLAITLILLSLASFSFIVLVILAKTLGREKNLFYEVKPRYEMFQGEKVCVNPEETKREDAFTFFDITSIYMTGSLVVSVLLLPLWNSIFFGLPYYYGVFNNLVFMWVQGPLKIAIYWLVLNALKKAGLMNVQNMIKGSYQKSKNGI